jgi:hypothetical protein
MVHNHVCTIANIDANTKCPMGEGINYMVNYFGECCTALCPTAQIQASHLSLEAVCDDDWRFGPKNIHCSAFRVAAPHMGRNLSPRVFVQKLYAS